MKGHTPGPWKVIREPDGGLAVITPETEMLNVFAREGRGQRRFGIGRADDEQSQADAALIAAAPALYTALRAILWQCEEADCPYRERVALIAEMARLALQKAAAE